MNKFRYNARLSNTHLLIQAYPSTEAIRVSLTHSDKMSSRRLRKIQQEKELEDAKRRAAEDEEDESADEPVSSNNKTSAFSAFAALEEEEDAEDSSEHEPEPEALPVSAMVPKARKPKKKKKKAKKPQAKSVETGNESDEIEAALRELNLKKPIVQTPVTSKTPQDLQWDRICSLLNVQTQFLKVGNEMRNLFGRAATDNHDDAGGRPGRQRQRHQVSNFME